MRFLCLEIIVIAKVCDCGDKVMPACGISGRLTKAVSQLLISYFFKLDAFTFNSACLLYFRPTFRKEMFRYNKYY